ncbi:MAG: hypothetical protein R3194_02215 [Limnobacter sp.]|nr:hypothetical protein [Limnobacter sp.]
MNSSARQIAISWWALVFVTTLAACGGATGPDGAGTGSPVQAQGAGQPPCFSDDCAMPQTIATIPDAENMVFGPNGKLYVTGGTDVFEINASGDSYTATGLSDGGCNFTGITFIENQLYAACGDGSFWTANLSDKPLLVKPFYQIDGMGLANGVTSSPDGQSLLVADGPLPANGPAPGRIFEIDLAAPGQASGDRVWLDMTGRFPNGLQRRGNTLFLTESVPPSLGQISRVNFNPDGSAASDPVQVVALSSIPDDFTLLPDGFAVTLFFDGSVVKYDFLGNPQEMTSRGRFETGTSQVRVGQGEDFRPNDVLVTVKGLIGDNSGPVGNKLVLYRRVQ